jgi:hypothetical protein
VRKHRRTGADLADRTFAAIAVWIAAVGTALHYGRQRGGEPEPGRRGYRIAQAIFTPIGVALAVASFLLGRGSRQG